MKKVVLGAAMFLSGLISTALIFAGSMAHTESVNGEFSSLWNVARFGLTPAVYLFAGIAAIGLALAVWGLFDKKD